MVVLQFFFQKKTILTRVNFALGQGALVQGALVEVMILWSLVLLGTRAAWSSPNAVPSLLCRRSPPAHALARLPVLALPRGSDLPGGGADAQIVDNQERTDWITFLTRAHLMTQEEVDAQIKTPAVLLAFERAKLSNLPADVRAAYDAEVREHDRYSQHIAEQISKGEKSAKNEVAQNLLAVILTVDPIEKANNQARPVWITRAKLSNLPADVRAAYDAEVREHDRYSQHIAEQISKGEKSAKIEVARNLLAMNLTVDQIEKATGLSSEDIKGIK